MFRDLSASIDANPPSLGYGACAFDATGEGTPAFLVAGYGFPARILLWEHGHLVDQFAEGIYDPDQKTLGVAAGDIDGDGREELYLVGADTFTGYGARPDRCFALRDGVWTDLFSLDRNIEFANAWSGRSVCAVDTDAGGRYAFWVANHGGPLRLTAWTDGDRLVDLAPERGLDRTGAGRALLAASIVSAPGRLDLLAANEHGPNLLFVPQAGGGYAEVAAEAGIADPGGHARGVCAMDLDGDGRLDLVCGNWQDEHRLWVQTAPGFFADAAPPALRSPSAVRNVVVGDFDNDGHEEIFFHQMGQPNRLFGWRDGEWKRLPIGDAAEPDLPGTGACVADIDGDGRLELLLVHGESAPVPLSLYRSAEGRRNHWLRVAPRTRFGAPARGAWVALTIDGRTCVRTIDGGSGYLCQNEPVAHFGLGDATKVERVEVVWPGGARAVLKNPAVDTVHRLAYPGG